VLDFAKIFEFVSTPLTVANAEKPNNLVYVNKAYCELTGYTAGELLGKNPGALLQHELYTKTREAIREKLDKHESIDVLVKNYRKDGSMFWNGLHIHPVIDDDGTCLYWVGMAKDVTQFVDEVSAGLEAIITTVKDSFQQMSQDIKRLSFQQMSQDIKRL
jgi:PAS domain S-box-containing protein